MQGALDELGGTVAAGTLDPDPGPGRCVARLSQV
jgi:hypothetical protein